MTFNILIVDDEPDNLRVLSSLLKSSYNILATKSGRQALKIVKQQQVDLILLDVIMPELDGFEVIQQLKSDFNTRDIPVIFITGLESSDDETYGFELGAVDYIHKPFQPSVVMARVASQLKIKQQTNELQELSLQLRQASEAKGMFLANMSHEIRTPLTTIIGYAESILNKTIASPDWLKAINIIDNSGRHLLSLVNNILDFSKIEAGELSIELIETDLNQLLQQVHGICQPQAKKKDLVLQWQFENELPFTIKTDPTRLKQILINLISNAIKFTEKGHINIVLAENKNSLKIAIEDTGIGIPSNKITSLFTSFSQVDESTTRQYGGTGLGLSISYKLAQRLGGTIEVESELNKGSTFTVSVGLVASDRKNTFNQLTADDQNSERQQIRKQFSGKALVAEDHPENRQLFYLTLTSLGLEVDTVENGEKAVQACISDNYQIIFMDIQMPIMNGIEAQNLIRNCGVSTPIIALTANVMKEEIEHYLSVGFTDYLTKPLEHEQLLNKLKTYCSFDKETQLDVEIPQELLNQLRTKFHGSFHQYIEELQFASEKNDILTIAKIAHKFQGAAKSFDFPKEAEVAESLERYIRQSSEQIQQTTHELLAALQQSQK